MIRSTTILFSLVLFLNILFSGAEAQMTERPRPTSLAGRSPVYAPRGAVATSQPLATGAALQVLQDGGNAIDAAVTAAAVLNVVEPHMTGIGGDMFALLWSAEEGSLVGLDASGRSGSLMTSDTLLALGLDDVPYRGPQAITVPGALSGWAALLERFGTLSLGEALAPAIRIAQEGFPVTPIIASQWRGTADILARDAGALDTFLRDGARGPQAGDWFRNPGLAETFEILAREGPDALYGGRLGVKLVEEIQEQGGFLTLDDLRNHEPEWVTPLSVEFKGYEVWELPPAGQGILVEAKKLAFADIARFVSDREHLEGDPTALLADGYVQGRREAIDPLLAAERADPGDPYDRGETIYLSVADQHGNMVSFINSIFEYFGSGVVVPGTGFALQNRGAGFTLEEGHPNRVGPRKRPFHTLIPGFVTRDGEPWMAFGVMGGSMQPQGHVQLLLNLLVFGMDIQEAVDAPRFRSYGGQRLALESPIDDQVRAALEAMGHQIIDEAGVSFGGAQAVVRLARGWAAGSDPRKDGMAAGH
jgi:gamma-glutamyltranspeptidase/glutathione hydrolase